MGFEWGDADGVIELIHKVAKREGDGRELADGSRALSQAHNSEDLAIHVKGLEVPNHDPRAFSGMATVYAVASRGATHLEGDMYSVDMGADVQELGIVSGDRLENEGKGRTAAMAQEYRAFFDSMIVCHFAIVPVPTQVELLNLATGSLLQIGDILKIGSRIVDMKRMFNLRCGLTPNDDRLPYPLLRPQAEQVTDDFVPDLAMQLSEYYRYRGWDLTTGKPGARAIEELGIKD
jgi:aldehyde:ferredoxin oxidoreductase